MRTYLVNNEINRKKDVFLLRPNFQKALAQEGLIKEIDKEYDKKVKIEGRDFNYISEIK